MTPAFKSIRPAFLITLCAVALLAGVERLGEARGEARAQVACEAGKTRAVAAEHQRYVAEIKRGDDAVAQLQAKLSAAQNVNDDLNRRLAHVPRFVSTHACPHPGAGQLTVAGLVRWNGALGYPGLSAGSCAAAGNAGAACAAGSGEQLQGPAGVSIDEAQTNAEINFGRCSEIRTRCLALIEFLKSRPTDGHATQENAP